jgi:hypothetical protein
MPSKYARAFNDTWRLEAADVGGDVHDVGGRAVGNTAHDVPVHMLVLVRGLLCSTDPNLW